MVGVLEKAVAPWLIIMAVIPTSRCFTILGAMVSRELVPQSDKMTEESPFLAGVQLHNYSSDSAVFSYGGHLFGSPILSDSDLTPPCSNILPSFVESLGAPPSYASTDDQLHFGTELEYLDLDAVHGTHQSSALANNFQIDGKSS